MGTPYGHGRSSGYGHGRSKPCERGLGRPLPRTVAATAEWRYLEKLGTSMAHIKVVVTGKASDVKFAEKPQ